jgi:hypothetical protein
MRIMNDAKRIFLIMAIVIVNLVAVRMANAITLSALDQGHLMDDGKHYLWTTNYAAGDDAAGRQFRSFYIFDLASLAGSMVTGATLNIFLPSDDGYYSPDNSETYSLYDILPTNVAPLVGTTLTSLTNLSIFEDLGNGVTYGNKIITGSDAGSIINIVLGASGLADINAAIGGLFGIGGAMTSINQPPEVQEVIFVNTQDIPLTNTTLVLLTTPVPEPTAILLLSLGLMGLVGVRRKMYK